jgi:hypothetical protein
VSHRSWSRSRQPNPVPAEWPLYRDPRARRSQRLLTHRRTTGAHRSRTRDRPSGRGQHRSVHRALFVIGLDRACCSDEWMQHRPLRTIDPAHPLIRAPPLDAAPCVRDADDRKTPRAPRIQASAPTRLLAGFTRHRTACIPSYPWNTLVTQNVSSAVASHTPSGSARNS